MVTVAIAVQIIGELLKEGNVLTFAAVVGDRVLSYSVNKVITVI